MKLLYLDQLFAVNNLSIGSGHSLLLKQPSCRLLMTQGLLNPCPFLATVSWPPHDSIMCSLTFEHHLHFGGGECPHGGPGQTVCFFGTAVLLNSLVLFSICKQEGHSARPFILLLVGRNGLWKEPQALESGKLGFIPQFHCILGMGPSVRFLF